jgi:hypothetical protein
MTLSIPGEGLSSKGLSLCCKGNRDICQSESTGCRSPSREATSSHPGLASSHPEEGARQWMDDDVEVSDIIRSTNHIRHLWTLTSGRINSTGSFLGPEEPREEARTL